MRTPTREFSREPTRPVSRRALLAALHSYAEQADTSYIIVAAAALERLLEQALLSKMRELSDSRYKDLSRAMGHWRPSAPKSKSVTLLASFQVNSLRIFTR